MELFFNYCEERKCFNARVDFGFEGMVLQLRPRMAVAIFSTLGSDPSGRQSRFSALTGSYCRGARLISLPGSTVPPTLQLPGDFSPQRTRASGATKNIFTLQSERPDGSNPSNGQQRWLPADLRTHSFRERAKYVPGPYLVFDSMTQRSSR